MNEEPPKPSEQEDTVQEMKDVKTSISLELADSGEIFPFPGLEPEGYNSIKASQEIETAEGYLYDTPIDELLSRFESEGIQVTIGQNAGNVYLIPSGSDDIVSDTIFPRFLHISEGMDERLKLLIQMDRSLYGS